MTMPGFGCFFLLLLLLSVLNLLHVIFYSYQFIIRRSNVSFHIFYIRLDVLNARISLHNPRIDIPSVVNRESGCC